MRTTSYTLFYREESHLPRLLTLPLALACALIIAVTIGRDICDTPHSRSMAIMVGGALCLTLLPVFAGVVIEVRETEVRFAIEPFYRRTIVIADIRHWSLQTQETPRWGVGRSWRAPRRGMALEMKDGSTMTLFTERPYELSNAIRHAKAKIQALGPW